MTERAPAPRQILLVEDELSLLASLGYLLEREGYGVQLASTGEEGLAKALDCPPDLVLLDVNLPGMDGFETARRLRCAPATRHCLIMMLTARAHPDDIVAGLSEVADDYVTKPFLPRVLVARIQALLRRAGGESAEPGGDHEILRCGDLTVDLTAHSVSMGDCQVRLTRTEFDILTLLASHSDRVFTRQQIIDRVRGDEYAITERVVDYQVSGLRKKLGAMGSVIQTVHGVGYKFVRQTRGAGEPVAR